MDRIEVRGIVCEAALGVSERERSKLQRVEVDLSLELDLDPAANTDDLELTVDYQELTESIRRRVGQRPFRLLEALAQSVCGAVLSHPRVETVTVTARKWPESMRGQVDCVEVRMTRGRR